MKNGTGCFNYMPVFSFGYSVLLRSMRAGDLMFDTVCLQEVNKLIAHVFSSSVRTNVFDFSGRGVFNLSFENSENLVNIRFMKHGK